MATKNETLISELKINYLTEELYAEALANGQINNDEIYMTPGSDLSIYVTKEELESKADAVHTHEISDINELQAKLDEKQKTITGAATTIANSNLTTNRALVSNGSGKVVVSAVTSTELGYLDGVTSSIQTQLNNKADSTHTHDEYVSQNELNSVPNLHVWKRYTSDPSIPVETTKSNVQIAWKISGMSSGSVINYSDSISVSNGQISLVEPSKITYNSTSIDTSILLGKYVFSIGTVFENDDNEGIYFISTSATFTKSDTALKVSSAKKLSIPVAYDCIGSTSSNAYSTSGQQSDGYWYVYNGQIGSHSHSEYANVKHIHDEYATSTHTHDEYMTSSNPSGTGSLSIGRIGDVGNYSATLGNACRATADFSLAFGSGSDAIAECSVAIGSGAIASGEYAVAIGANGISSNGTQYNGAIGQGSVMLGYACESTGDYSFSTGEFNRASGANSQAFGYKTTSLRSQHAQGHYNDTSNATAGNTTGTTGTAFIIGNGTSSSASNACRITYAGAVIGKAGYQSTGADYAEYFEWADGNVDNEERIGYFVTFDDGEFIRKANEDEYILGIVSGNPAVLGNNDECWRGQNEMDEWNRFIYVTETNEETGETYETYKVNPEYDSTLQYIPRADRPEWDAVGMLGVLSVRDDGTCKVNGYCKVADGGIATASDTGYRVIKRVTDNIIKVVFR